MLEIRKSLVLCLTEEDEVVDANSIRGCFFLDDKIDVLKRWNLHAEGINEKGCRRV